MTRIRNKTLKKIFDSGHNLTPAKWGRAIDIMYPNPDEGKDKIINTTYKELVDMIASNELIPGATYEFDYNNFLPIRHPNGFILVNQQNESCQVRVRAISTNNISEDALYNGVRQCECLDIDGLVLQTRPVKIWNKCKYSLNTPYQYNWVEIENSGINIRKIIKLGTINELISEISDATYPFVLNDDFWENRFWENHLIKRIDAYDVRISGYDEYGYSIHLETYDGDEQETEKHIYDLQIQRNSISIWKHEYTRVDIIFSPRFITGFVYDINVKCTNPYNDIYYNFALKENFTKEIRDSFLSYDISVFVNIGEQVVFIGDINKDHILYGADEDMIPFTDAVIHHCECIDSWVYNYAWLDSDGGWLDVFEENYGFPLFGRIINSRVYALSIIFDGECDGFLANQYQPLHIENIIMPLNILTGESINNILELTTVNQEYSYHINPTVFVKGFENVVHDVHYHRMVLTNKPIIE